MNWYKTALQKESAYNDPIDKLSNKIMESLFPHIKSNIYYRLYDFSESGFAYDSKLDLLIQDKIIHITVKYFIIVNKRYISQFNVAGSFGNQVYYQENETTMPITFKIRAVINDKSELNHKFINSFINRNLSDLYMKLAKTLRHELQHSQQDRQLKIDDFYRNDMEKIPTNHIMDDVEYAITRIKNHMLYFMRPTEIEAQVMSFYYESRKNKKSFYDIMERHIDIIRIAKITEIQEQYPLNSQEEENSVRIFLEGILDKLRNAYITKAQELFPDAIFEPPEGDMNNPNWLQVAQNDKKVAAKDTPNQVFNIENVENLTVNNYNSKDEDDSNSDTKQASILFPSLDQSMDSRTAMVIMNKFGDDLYKVAASISMDTIAVNDYKNNWQFFSKNKAVECYNEVKKRLEELRDEAFKNGIHTAMIKFMAYRRLHDIQGDVKDYLQEHLGKKYMQNPDDTTGGNLMENVLFLNDKHWNSDGPHYPSQQKHASKESSGASAIVYSEQEPQVIGNVVFFDDLSLPSELIKENDFVSYAGKQHKVKSVRGKRVFVDAAINIDRIEEQISNLGEENRVKTSEELAFIYMDYINEGFPDSYAWREIGGPTLPQEKQLAVRNIISKGPQFYIRAYVERHKPFSKRRKRKPRPLKQHKVVKKIDRANKTIQECKL